jgi:glycine cleavage system T protein
MTSSYASRFFGADTGDVDPLTDTLIRLEEERQERRIILIPSESYVPWPVRQALGSVFTNIYAEGYPPSQMVDDDEELLSDLAQQLAYYRRYADRRFYKGADYVHFVESLAQRRAAACFANERVAADGIFCNVQPLSGAAANLAVYDAIMEPGDTLMGMDLFQGGHLTHGSEFNVSGKRYRVVSYGVGRDGRLDYDQVREVAERSRPKVIVAGYTSFPWAPDFEAFREIADKVGAYLMADIAHPAGMVIAGVYPNPVGLADVVTFTTHKTLCGPRGACILTTSPALAREIDSAVFPGLQGGPHTNKFAAMCVAFEIARTEPFLDLQRRIVANAQALARGLTDRGLGLAYGGTDTHLLLLDLKSAPQPNGQPLYGEVVARILELAGIVVNKNTIPGDTVTALATGIRMGTPWVTQRGMGPQEMDRLAECIARLVKGIVPFTYEGLEHALSRGKIDLDELEAVKRLVDDLACEAEVEVERRGSGYPHFCLLPQQPETPQPLLAPEEGPASDGGAVLLDMSDLGHISVSGWRAKPFLEDLCTADIAGLDPGRGTRSFLLDRGGHVIDDVTVWRYPSDERGRDHYGVVTTPENTARVVSWMRGISDGYVLFDDEDVWRKVRGPAKVEELTGDGGKYERIAMIGLCGPQAETMLRQVLGQAFPEQTPTQAFTWAQILYADRIALVARCGYALEDTWYTVSSSDVALRVLWEALVEAGAAPAGVSHGRGALREAAGLPAWWSEAAEQRDPAPYVERLPHMFDLHKPYFVGQQALPNPEVGPERPAFAWAAPADPPLKRTPLYEEHVRLGAKMVPFAGWEMPVWYTRVSDEHRAVREAAGLFDVAHMGTLEVCGPHAADFLDLVTVNYVRWLEDGESQYSALLDADGQILDDILVYRRARDRYFVVVNAANFDKDWAWLNSVNGDEVLIDAQRPWVRVRHGATLRDLKDLASGAAQRIDIALQGPRSRQILLACVDEALGARLQNLERTMFLEGTIGGIDMLISRTGYTGEAMGFELYVHPDRAVDLWRLLLDRGAPYGIVPCGLAARDSLRIEAGLPLYGHELAGPLGISQTEAGFGAYVKYHKPFYIGRTPYKAYNDQSTRQIVRFAVQERGARAIRGGEHGEPVLSRRGKVIGTVTSCTLVGEQQVGMALVDGRYTEVGTELFIYPEARRVVGKVPSALDLGDNVALPVRAEVLTRFPDR